MKYVFVFHKMLSDEEYNLDIYMSNMLNVIFDFDLDNSKTPLKYYCHKTGDLITFPRHTIDIFGDIRNEKGHIMSVTGKKYHMSTAADLDGKYRGLQIHRAMCSSFLERLSSKHTADHIDRLPSNNCLWNLRWASLTDQIKNQNKRKEQVDGVPVIGTHIETGKIIRFSSTSCARAAGYYHVSDCLSGKREHSGGYIWSCPEELPDIPGEAWKLWRTGQYKVWISDMNRIMYEFSHGYRKKMYSTELALRGDYNAVKDTESGGSQNFHRVVWTVFNGYIPCDKIINHIDHDKSNNSLDNLEIISQSENGFAAHAAGRFDNTKVKRQSMVINGVEYTSSYDAAMKLNPNITDKKELKRLRSLYRNRCVSSTYPDYVFV